MKKGKKIIIGCVILAAAAAAVFGVRKFTGGSGSSTEGTVYVQSVADMAGTSGIGVINRYTGVVESQDTWSVDRNSDAEVAEIYVSAGDKVSEGTPLFRYSVEKYRSDLSQASIDLERLQNEQSSISSTIAALQKEKQSAAASEQANYTIQIQEQELSLKQKELDIQSKQIEMAKLQSNIENATVTSKIAGVVKSVNTGDTVSQDSTGDNSFITVMKTGDLQIKGSVNEANVYELYTGMPVIIYSRVDDSTWTGTIEKVDTENAQSSGSSFYSTGSGESSSSSYPFYVTLDSSEGLIMGQHVYIEENLGQNEVKEKEGLWIYSYMIDFSDPDRPFVWLDEKGSLVKREVELGEYDETTDTYQITAGLSKEDSIAFPDTSLEEGMKTIPAEEAAETVSSDEEIMTDSAAEEWE